MARKYIYGIISNDGERSFGPIGLGGGSRDVYTIACQGLGCLVSDYHGKELQAMTKEEVVRSLFLHQAAIEAVMKRHTVLPVKFGTVLEGSTHVRCFMEQGYTQLNNALLQMQDKVEVEIVATWDMSNVLQEIGNEEEIVSLKEGIMGKRAEDTLEQRIEVGKRVKELLDRRRDSYRDRMIDFLKDTALDLQPNALLSDELVLNVAFLIHKAKQEHFYSRVKALNILFHDEIDFRIIGPLPPYSFSTIEVVRPSAKELEEARQLLSLEEEVCEAEVKEAYRRLAARTHPDCNPGDEQAEQRFAKLRKASMLLLAYCRGRGGSRHTEEERYPLSSHAIEDTFLIYVKRSAVSEAHETAIGSNQMVVHYATRHR